MGTLRLRCLCHLTCRGWHQDSMRPGLPVSTTEHLRCFRCANNNPRWNLRVTFFWMCCQRAVNGWRMETGKKPSLHWWASHPCGLPGGRGSSSGTQDSKCLSWVLPECKKWGDLANGCLELVWGHVNSKGFGYDISTGRCPLDGSRKAQGRDPQTQGRKCI